MPVALERKLKRTAKRRGYGKKRTGAYVYGTLNKIKSANHEGMMKPGRSSKVKMNKSTMADTGCLGSMKSGTMNPRNWG